jgi:hypothetical protein
VLSDELGQCLFVGVFILIESLPEQVNMVTERDDQRLIGVHVALHFIDSPRWASVVVWRRIIHNRASTVIHREFSNLAKPV